MISEEKQKELDRLLDGDLSDKELAHIQADLEKDPEAIEWLADRAWMHVNLRKSMQRRGLEAGAEKVAQQKVVSFMGMSPNALRSVLAIAAVMVLMLTIFFKKGPVADPSFATLEVTHAALWESGDLPTADGSRLGKGTLRLAEGLATLKFDSGAEVVLEAPATLVLVDSMNCQLTSGTAVSDIPESALGFRIKTPTADVVDYGTRFAVSVFEQTGETHTQVIEGKVQVEDGKSGEVVELTTGQRNTVYGKILGKPTDGKNQEPNTLPAQPVEHGPNWKLLKPLKDAYTGNVKSHNSDTLLLVKKSLENDTVTRIAYIGFDISSIDQSAIEEAELLLHFTPTGWGLASHVPDSQFSVYGMVGEVPEWDESILHGEFPGNPETVHLGAFIIPQGVQKGRFQVKTEALADFLRNHPEKQISFKVVRDTIESENGGLVHGFASRRHPVLPPPTLAIRENKVIQ